MPSSGSNKRKAHNEYDEYTSDEITNTRTQSYARNGGSHYCLNEMTLMHYLETDNNDKPVSKRQKMLASFKERGVEIGANDRPKGMVEEDADGTLIWWSVEENTWSMYYRCWSGRISY